MASPSAIPLVRYTVRVETRGRADAPANVYDDQSWHIRSIKLTQELSHPYHMTLVVLTEEHGLRAEDLIAAKLLLSCSRSRDERLLHGVIQRVQYLGTFAGHTHLRFDVGPALSYLSLSRRSRIFQHETVDEIAKQVVADVFGAFGRRLETSHLHRRYDQRDYCVQHGETDLAFLQRILAEEGITYLFEHEEDAETLVLLDDSRSFPSIGVSLLEGEEQDEPPRYVPVVTKRHEHPDEEAIDRFEWFHRAHAGRVERSVWDWKQWNPERIEGTATAEPAEPWHHGEHYSHAERRLLEDQGEGEHLDATPRWAEDHRDHLIASAQAAHGSGNVLSFSPGHTFELSGHPHPAMDAEYTVTRVVHEADLPEADIEDTGVFAGPNYVNRFECIPRELVWRPEVPSRPRIYGYQLATVVGPAGEEIHTDQHGRIKVWMHWDRENASNEPDTSCWLRVAQTWAGPGWGTMFIPRVGMEVLVAFIEGDPDRPICVGCVYNGKNQPPYPLPDDKTKSTLKSSSSPGGDGFNELRFEDAAGSEEVFLHAQKDFNEVVRSAHSRLVGASETISVGKDRTVGVSGNQSVTITGNHSFTVEGNEDGTPLPGPNCLVDVKRDYELRASANVMVQAEQSITLKCQGTSVTLTPGGIVLQAGPGASTSLDASAMVRSSAGAMLMLGGGGTASLGAMGGGAAGGPQSSEPSGAKLELGSDVGLTSEAGANLLLDGEVNLAASGKGASVNLSTDAEMSGNKVELTAAAGKVTLTTDAKVEGMTVELAGGDVKCSGAKSMTITAAQVMATGMTTITMNAPLISIN